ncbi:hypothetical protein B0F90DRAFT_936985 [Multifurca ochricompacta]|uniref:Uncharacterized protein n=1 Tax=Multifurca ochricompacta TaxID=376703 RepID=A0AAD4MB86_9AGAM|nr:hypothetical protein B0F90DRAFT_936985 [Multifurca ochricompacta]
MVRFQNATIRDGVGYFKLMKRMPFYCLCHGTTNGSEIEIFRGPLCSEDTNIGHCRGRMRSLYRLVRKVLCSSCTICRGHRYHYLTTTTLKGHGSSSKLLARPLPLPFTKPSEQMGTYALIIIRSCLLTLDERITMRSHNQVPSGSSRRRDSIRSERRIGDGAPRCLEHMWPRDESFHNRRNVQEPGPRLS